jgi:hypothetical protein
MAFLAAPALLLSSESDSSSLSSSLSLLLLLSSLLSLLSPAPRRNFEPFGFAAAVDDFAPEPDGLAAFRPLSDPDASSSEVRSSSSLSSLVSLSLPAFLKKDL